MLRLKTLGRLAAGVATAAVLALAPNAACAQSGEPIKIGFSMSLTGPLAANGKQALLGAKIWEEETNGKGGLIGRPVKLIFYDDQSNPSQVPGIYQKLLDVDKVDLVVSSYATNMIAPAMPVVMQKNKFFLSLFGLDVNAEFKYPKYFSVLPTGQDTKESFTEGFYEAAMKQNPKPTTVALAAEDAEFSRNACEGARANAKKYNLKIVYDKQLSAGHDRLRADRARRAGGEPRHLRHLLLSALVGRHGADDQRAELQAEDGRRRDGRPAGHRVQAAARLQAQRHRQLRDLGADREESRGDRRLLQEVSGQGRRRRRRPDRLLSRRLGLCLDAACWAKRSPPPRASTTTRSPTISARPLQDHHGQLGLRREAASGPSPACCRCSITT